MDKPNGCRFSLIPVIIFLISCLILSGCEGRPDWSDKDENFLITQLKSNRFYAVNGVGRLTGWEKRLRIEIK